MIKINLTPEEELQNPWWYFPDIIMAVVMLAVCYATVVTYLSTREEFAESIVKETASIRQQTVGLEATIKRVEQASTDLKSTEELLIEVKPLTSSQISRYLPLIVLEHLQSLRPEGMWYTKINFLAEETTAAAPPAAVASAANAPGANNGDLKVVELEGAALDYLLVAELLTSLRSTQSQEAESADPRTQVFFSQIKLKKSQLQPASAVPGSFYVSKANQEEPRYATFSITLVFSKREATQAVDMLTSGVDFNVDTSLQLAGKSWH